MGGFTRAVTIGGAISGLLAAAIWQLKDLITPMLVAWTCAYLGARLFALYLSWGVTNAWKYDRWTDEEWHSLAVKRAIRRFARWSCAIAQLLIDVVIVLLAWPVMAQWEPRIWVAAILVAVMSLLALAMWSPDLWKWVYKVLLPRINASVRAAGDAAPDPAQPPHDYAPGDDDTLDPSGPPKPPLGS